MIASKILVGWLAETEAVLPGLDSFAALNVMEYLSQLGAMGHTIIASIHQPRADIFNKFNKVR